MVFASTVRFTTNTASGPLLGGLWVGLLSGYIVSLTGGFRPFVWGVAYFGCVGGFSEGVTPSILSEPGS